MAATKKLINTKIAFIDTETTGLDPLRNDIWQIACLIEDRGEIIAEKNWFMAPRDASAIDQEALDLQGLTKEQLLAHPPAPEVMKDFKKFLAFHVNKYQKADKMVAAGYNVKFGLDFLRGAFAKDGDKYFDSWFFSAPIDVMGFVGLLVARGFRFKDHKLATICADLGIALDAHDALSDIRATRQLFQGLRGLVAIE